MFIGTKDLSFVQAIDLKIDGAIDPQNGDFRYYQSAGVYRLALKNMKYK
jgi:hypothetical protein